MNIPQIILNLDEMKRISQLITPVLTFSCESSLLKKPFSHMEISQLHNTVYIAYPDISSILAFDLQGHFLCTIKITAPNFIIGKFCPLSDTVMVVCNQYSSRKSIHLMTTEGIFITNFLQPDNLGTGIRDCISCEKHNVFFILTDSELYSYGKEGMMKMTNVFRRSDRNRGIVTLKEISMLDEEMNLIIENVFSSNLYLYNPRDHSLELFHSGIPASSSAIVFDGYIFYPDFRRERYRIGVCPVNSTTITYVVDLGRYTPVYSKVEARSYLIHFASRMLYIGDKCNVIKVYNIDELLRVYQKMNRK